MAKTQLTTLFLLAVLLPACDFFNKKKDAPESESVSAASVSAKAETPLPAKPRAHRELSRKELLSAKVREGIMSVEQATTGANAAPPRDPSTDPQEFKPHKVEDEAMPKEELFDFKPFAFSRVAGGPGGFCGVAPLSCWGRREMLWEGAYLDVAVTQTQVCAIQYTGTIECVHKGSEVPGRVAARRIAASRDQFCALLQDGKMTCWGKGEVAAPPTDLKAKFFSVAENFACAADENNELRCWGQTEGLGLPEQPLLIKDLAAGSNFVCVLPQQGQLQCFGSAPQVPAGDYAAIGAGFGTLCAVSSEGGECWGALSHKFTSKVKRFAVSDSGVCAQLAEGGQDCVDQGGKPIALPLDKRQYEEAVKAAQERNEDARRQEQRKADARREEAEAVTQKKNAALFQEMRKLFPAVSSPPSLKPDGRFSLGDRIPAKFDPLFRNFAADHLAGVHWTNPGGTVSLTAFHLPSQSMHLYVFMAEKSGKMVEDIRLWERRDKSYKQGNSSVRWAEGVLHSFDEEGNWVTTTLTGTETTFHTKDGKGTSKIQCLIGGESYVREFFEYGLKSERKRLPRPKSISRSSLSEGCGNEWPFIEADQSDGSFDPSRDNVVPLLRPADPENPCAQLRDVKGNLAPGVRSAELVYLADAAGERWVPESTTQPEDFNEGGNAFGSLTGLRGKSHWEISEQRTNASRSAGFYSKACYGADGELLAYQLEVTSPSGTQAKKKVLVAGGSGAGRWTYSSLTNQPSTEAAFGDKSLLNELSIPPKRVKDHPRFGAIERGLK